VTTIDSSPETEQVVELAPSYRIPLGLVLLSIPVLLVQPWLGSILALLGLFLMIQTATIRLQFTPTALDVCRSGNLIRRFPYSQWYSWNIFWRPFPILFYFKEVKSIHFLPILFEVKTLTSCLEKYCPNNQ
jgi:hypothetical protein